MSIRRNIYPMAFLPDEKVWENPVGGIKQEACEGGLPGKELAARFAEALDGKAITISRRKTIFHREGEDRLLSEPTGKAREKKVYEIRLSPGTLPPDGRPLVLFEGSVIDVINAPDASNNETGRQSEPMAKQAIGENLMQRDLTLGEKKDIFEGAAKHLKGIGKKLENIVRLERGRNESAFLRQEETLPLLELDAEQKKKLAKRLRICTDKEKIRFEVYASEETRPCAEEIAEAFRTVFQSTEDMTFDIQIRRIGRLANPLDPTGAAAVSKRIREIERVVDLAQDLVGCVILMPGVSEDAETVGKTLNISEGATDSAGYDRNPAGQATDLLVRTMRAGFALRNHLTYFMEPWQQDAPRPTSSQKQQDAQAPALSEPHRPAITAAMEDLLFQMGYVRELEEARKYVEDGMDRVPLAGAHLLKNLHVLHGKTDLLPMCVTVNYIFGRIFTECSAFGRGRLHYYEAAFELARLSINPEFERKCHDCRRDMFRQKLLVWAELYKKDPFVVLLDADPQARKLYPGFDDEMLKSYEYEDTYRPSQLEIGTPESPRTANFNGTGLRILRMRRGSEVPDTYGEAPGADGYGATSGLFKYENTYWTIPPIRSKASQDAANAETRNPAASSIDPRNPAAAGTRRDLMEVYPIQVQKNDYPDKWVSHANALRLLQGRPDNEGVMPLPFYLIEKLERYVLQY